MSTSDIERRITALEQRLAGVEKFLLTQVPVAAGPQLSQSVPTANAGRRLAPSAQPRSDSKIIGNILGWGGAIALLLAASYLIKLAIDSGWLTPIRQVSFAAIFGLLLIGAGFPLRRNDREYAGLLPAAGIAVLFLTIYGGHLYHRIIGVQEAGAAVIIVCAISLWLCRAFESDLFALFAVAGSYFAPFLLQGVTGSLSDVAIYYSAWGAVFSVFAVWHGRRLIYLLALYLALIGFDILWRSHGGADQWIPVMIFQTAQFVIFGIATAVFSVRHNSPLSQQEALAHLPPLLLFYFLQYSLLQRYLPELAPWIAVGSLAALALIYTIARYALRKPLAGGELLLWCYAALVLFHAGYIESVPKELAPWVGFIIVPIVAVVSIREDDGFGSRWPIWVAVGIAFGVNYLRIIFDTDVQSVPAKQLLAIAYSILLYLGYWFSRQKDLLGPATAVLLYMGHVCAMAASLHLLHEPIIESVVWGVLAISCLGLSLYVKDKLMGQSSVAVFGATAGKVLLYDLSGASTIARIVGLVVIGVTFYVGGMLYQRMLGKNA